MGKFFGRNRLKAFLLLNVLVGILWSSGCSFKNIKDQGVSSDMPSKVADTLSQCIRCHSGASAPAGFSFVTDAAQMIKAGLIIPGEAENSVLYQKVSSSPPYGDRMPKGGPYLSASQLSLLASWINNLGVVSTVAITSPTDESYIYSSNSSITFPILGTCSVTNALITLYVNGVASPTTATCDGTSFSMTVDTTTGSTLFADGSNTLYVNMNEAQLQKSADSSEITLNRDLAAASITISSHSDSPSTSDRFATDADTSVVTADSFTVSGQCSPNGSPIAITMTNTVLSRSATVATTTCGSGVFSVTANSASLADFANYKLTATLDGPSTDPVSNVVVFKSVSPTVLFASDIAPLLAQPVGSNKRACVDCHYQKITGNASSNLAMGYWNSCATAGTAGAPGGKPTGTTGADTAGTCSDALSGNTVAYGTCNDPAADAPSGACTTERNNFKFRFGYYRYSTTTAANNEGGYSNKALSIVNDNPDVANSLTNRIVRGNPNQSFIYKKVAGRARNPGTSTNIGAISKASTAIASFSSSATPGMTANSLNFIVGDSIRFTGATIPVPLVNTTIYYVKEISNSAGTTSIRFSGTPGGADIDTSLGDASTATEISSQDACQHSSSVTGYVSTNTGCRTSGATGGNRMPAYNATYMPNYFDDTQLAKIRTWIEQGARTDN